MPLSLPTLKMLNTHLNSLGNAVKSAGPSLFSATQTPGPGAVQDTSMMMDARDTNLNPTMAWQDTGLNSTSFGSLNPAMPSLSGPQNPYYNMGQQGGQMGNGTVGAFDGGLGALNAYDAAFAQAGAEQGIDPNWLKALAAEEGGWGAGAESGAGALGIMQIMPGGYGNLEAMYPGWQTDPTQNIRLGAAILKAKMQENGGSLEMGTQRYLGTGTDPYTGISTGQYLSSIQNYYQQLQQNGGSFSGGTTGGSLGSMFANGTVPEWGEFGAASNLGYYGYGTSYGLNGSQHTGVDVPMPVGSAYRAPMSGTVMCAGTNRGQGADGGGCSAFGDYYGNGAGRVEVLLDNGVVLIFGHSSTSAFAPGTHFNAGDVLGTSGGMNSPHVHLEARVRDPSMPSGWRIVDPRTVVGGGMWSGGGQTAGGYGSNFGQSQSSGMGRISEQIGRFYAGRR